MPFLYLLHFLVQETSKNIFLQQEEKIIINSNKLKSLIKANLRIPIVTQYNQKKTWYHLFETVLYA